MAIYNTYSWIILILGLVFFSSCEEKKTLKEPNQKIDGKVIYEQNCKVCHGSKGDLGVGDAADLSKSEKTFAEKIYIITNGSESGKMTSFKRVLIEEEIDAVAKFIETLKN